MPPYPPNRFALKNKAPKMNTIMKPQKRVPLQSTPLGVADPEKNPLEKLVTQAAAVSGLSENKVIVAAVLVVALLIVVIYNLVAPDDNNNNNRRPSSEKVGICPANPSNGSWVNKPTGNTFTNTDFTCNTGYHKGDNNYTCKSDKEITPTPCIPTKSKPVICPSKILNVKLWVNKPTGNTFKNKDFTCNTGYDKGTAKEYTCKSDTEITPTPCNLTKYENPNSASCSLESFYTLSGIDKINKDKLKRYGIKNPKINKSSWEIEWIHSGSMEPKMICMDGYKVSDTLRAYSCNPTKGKWGPSPPSPGNISKLCINDV